MVNRILTVLVIVACSSTSAQAQYTPDPADVETLDGIIDAYYEVVSGPAGSIPDRARDLYIHIEDAPVIIMNEDAEGNIVANKMNISEFHDRMGGARQSGFFEVEIHRETQQYGAMTHIWSTYEWRTTEDGPVGGRGVNSIQLYNDGTRWWISSEIYDSRNKPVPKQYMPK